MSPPMLPGNMQRTDSQDSTADSLRKRVCKACDRCRMKKSKCNGEVPCSRCKADDQICVFGERKRSHDKIYPKGYVEQLEQQQGQMASGLRELYQRALSDGHWRGSSLAETDGKPLVHDILAGLGLLLDSKTGDEAEPFIEDFKEMQKHLISNGAPLVHRRGSVSSDSDRSQHRSSRAASNITPLEDRRKVFRDSFTLASAQHTPLTQSPTQRLATPTSATRPTHRQPQWQQPQVTQPMQMNPPPPQTYAPEWQQLLANNNTNPFPLNPPPQMPVMRGNDVMMSMNAWDSPSYSFDMPASNQGFPNQQTLSFNDYNPYTNTGMNDLMDDNFDMSKYEQGGNELMI
ncbi:hypothetical protein B0A48_12686 [Cryoendolithus antarcticus]|uniref:Zn(2)-C6 fungal-type domain-containing protein n=1 Tax=Cryoendolithus antarcticus TaxID=1507870 RepID=A0A1V8SRF8_9PEZI|nr:hypothetical protein B0A48_12686 [Cryoendolithus antarcticus]